MMSVRQASELASTYLQAGNLQAAEHLYRQVLSSDPRHVDALHGLGLIAFCAGRYDLAASYIRQALSLRPDFAEAHSNLGNVLVELNQLEDAVACFREALRLRPGFAEAHSNLGNALLRQGQWEAAARSLLEALRLKPDLAAAHNHLGNVYCEQGKLDEAAECYRRALRCNPHHIDALRNLAVLLLEHGRAEGSIGYFQHVLQLQPELAEMHHRLGAAFQVEGRLEEAVASYRQALHGRPTYAEAYADLGLALLGQGKEQEALDAVDSALRLKPDFAAAHATRGLALLLGGDFARGWPEYEWRLRCPEFSAKRLDCPQPVWDGAPLERRTILLRAEQGLGDTLQFVRYLPLVQQRGGSIVLQVQAALLSLLRTSMTNEQVIALEDTPPPFDVHASLLSLPGLLGTTLGNVPVDVPYLFADPALVEQWRNELQAYAGFKIGIVWQGRAAHAKDRWRSVPVAAFAPLAGLKGVHLLSLQVGAGHDQLAGSAIRFPVVDLGGRFDAASFADTAAVARCLDLVITVDTAMAHLAGALGVPVWVALPFAPDWRWLLGRDDSPWYPTMRLFRQGQPGRWSAVFERITVEVRKLVADAP